MCSKYLIYCLQDIRLKKWLFWLVACSILILQLLAVLFATSQEITWRTLKYFVLYFRYEFTYLPIFLILLATFSSKENDWQLLRRYSHRQQIASYKICFVLLVTAFFTAIVLLGSMMSNAASGEIVSLLYFSYIFFAVTAIFGLLYIVFQQLVQNNFISVILVWIIGIADSYSVHIVGILYFKSEFTSPISTFIIIIAVTILLVSAIYSLINKLNFYVRDDTS